MNYHERFLYYHQLMLKPYLLFSNLPINVSLTAFLSESKPDVIAFEFEYMPEIYSIPDALMLINVHIASNGTVVFYFSFKQ